jgi:hypothetical protein
MRALEIDPRRHQRQPPFGDFRGKTIELAAVRQQLARTLGLVVFARGRTVGRDVHGVQPQLAVLDRGIAVLQLGAGLAQRLHLGALEHDPALDAFDQLVAIGRVPVRGDVARSDLALLLLALGHRFRA